MPTPAILEGTGGNAEVAASSIEFGSEIDRSLDAVTVDDLPDPYRGPEATLLPVQEVTADDLAEAHRRMTAVIEALYDRGLAALEERGAA